MAVYSKIITFAPTNMEKERMILLRIAGRTTQGKAYFGKALSNLLSVKESVYMLYRITNTVNISTNAWIFLCYQINLIVLESIMNLHLDIFPLKDLHKATNLLLDHSISL